MGRIGRPTLSRQPLPITPLLWHSHLIPATDEAGLQRDYSAAAAAPCSPASSSTTRSSTSCLFTQASKLWGFSLIAASIAIDRDSGVSDDALAPQAEESSARPIGNVVKTIEPHQTRVSSILLRFFGVRSVVRSIRSIQRDRQAARNLGTPCGARRCRARALLSLGRGRSPLVSIGDQPAARSQRLPRGRDGWVREGACRG